MELSIASTQAYSIYDDARRSADVYRRIDASGPMRDAWCADKYHSDQRGEAVRSVLVRLNSLLMWSLAGAMLSLPQVALAAAATPFLYVDNSKGNNISVISISEHSVVATVPVGDLPHAICASVDGQRVYTTTESKFTLEAIDTHTNTVVNSWLLPADPNECAVTKSGRYVIVPLRDNTVRIVDTLADKIIKTLTINGPHNCFTAMGGSDHFVYCEEERSFDIAKIDLSSMEVVERIPINGQARPFVVTPDTKTIYAAISGLSGVAIVNVPAHLITQVVLPTTKQLTCTIEPGNTPTHGIALTPDLKELWITDVAGRGVYVYDVATKTMSRKIVVGMCPNWLSVSANGRYVAVSNAESNSVSIIDAHARKVLWDVPVGKGPKRLEFVNVPARDAPRGDQEGSAPRP